jgi:hypothetical protein
MESGSDVFGRIFLPCPPGSTNPSMNCLSWNYLQCSDLVGWK